MASPTEWTPESQRQIPEQADPDADPADSGVCFEGQVEMIELPCGLFSGDARRARRLGDGLCCASPTQTPTQGPRARHLAATSMRCSGARG